MIDDMTSITKTLADKKLITPPPFVPGSIQYEVLMGSEAYGVSSDQSDRDIYGFCVPPKSTVFPHTAGEIEGFGRQKKRFQQYQQHHVYSAEARKGRGCEYDLAIYNSLPKFMRPSNDLYNPDSNSLWYLGSFGTSFMSDYWAQKMW